MIRNISMDWRPLDSVGRRLLVELLASVVLLAAVTAQAAQPQSIQLSAVAKRALVEKALTLKKGDAYSKVIGQLGQPTIDQKIGAGSKFLLRSLKFYVAKSAGGYNEARDEHIDVILDAHDRVTSIYIKVEVE